jgi:DnaJ family protein C protein 13
MVVDYVSGFWITCDTDLAPYKYAGYSQLIKTIQMETTDDTLFSKSAPLLAGAMELCYYTLACSPLNAEQLRRDDGLEVRV